MPLRLDFLPDMGMLITMLSGNCFALSGLANLLCEIWTTLTTHISRLPQTEIMLAAASPSDRLGRLMNKTWRGIVEYSILLFEISHNRKIRSESPCLPTRSCRPEFRFPKLGPFKL